VLFVGFPGARQLDAQAQSVRVLPAPDVRAVAAALTDARRTAAEATSPARKQEPRPVRIVIPAIGVAAPIIPLGLNPDHSMQVPRSFSVAGWFRPGPEPGEPGAAIVLGHVDSKSGPGVFFHLRALRRGDKVKIVLADRRTLRFVVTGSIDASKTHFPSRLVYRRTPEPTLRLITCGGPFNSATGHYVDNHIVFARLLGRG
jgi:sortase (surface protein transpeptidase)